VLVLTEMVLVLEKTSWDTGHRVQERVRPLQRT
jgi:hypothetical protein